MNPCPELVGDDTIIIRVSVQNRTQIQVMSDLLPVLRILTPKPFIHHHLLQVATSSS